VIFDQIFVMVYQRIAYSLLNSDKLVIALRLAQIKLGKNMQDAFFDVIRGADLLATSLDTGLLQGKLSKAAVKALHEL